MTRTCPACGAASEDAARFCSDCGRPLAGDAAADAPPSPSPPPVPPHAGAPAAPPTRPAPPVYSAAAAPPPPYVGGGAAKEAPALIPTHNKPALFGYYLGVFSLIPCLGLPLGIAALVLGVLGLRKQRADPAVKGKGHAWTAVVLGALTTIAWGVVPLALWLVGAASGW